MKKGSELIARSLSLYRRDASSNFGESEVFAWHPSRAQPRRKIRRFWIPAELLWHRCVRCPGYRDPRISGRWRRGVGIRRWRGVGVRWRRQRSVRRRRQRSVRWRRQRSVSGYRRIRPGGNWCSCRRGYRRSCRHRCWCGSGAACSGRIAQSREPKDQRRSGCGYSEIGTGRDSQRRPSRGGGCGCKLSERLHSQRPGCVQIRDERIQYVCRLHGHGGGYIQILHRHSGNRTQQAHTENARCKDPYKPAIFTQFHSCRSLLDSKIISHLSPERTVGCLHPAPSHPLPKENICVRITLLHLGCPPHPEWSTFYAAFTSPYSCLVIFSRCS